MKKRILIVGGVAGGASCATRLRRLSEEDEIIIYEKGPYVSFSNCSIPYHLSGIVNSPEDLILVYPEDFKKSYNIEVKVNHEVYEIDRINKKIKIKDVITNQILEEDYDKLVLSPGALPIKPNIPGIEEVNTYTIRNVSDVEKLSNDLKLIEDKNIALIGGGYIGIEVAENLAKGGYKVTIIEALNQILKPFDYDLVQIFHKELIDHGVELIIEDKVVSFEKGKINLESGKVINTNTVIMAIGVTPETNLAKDSGIELGKTKAIKVNEYYQTSDEDIYAVGDAIEVVHEILNEETKISLAGPAVKQARIAANHINGIKDKDLHYLGSSAIKVFDYNGAATGLNENLIQMMKLDINYRFVYFILNDKVGLMPDVHPMFVKVIYEIPSGRILGAQAIGKGSVDKRVDVIATAIKYGGKIDELHDLELCYAPPFSTAKDLVNYAGYIGENLLKEDFKQVDVTQMRKLIEDGHCLVDVREKWEYERGHINEALNIPLSELRGRMQEIPKDKEVVVYCRTGQRSYNAVLALQNSGFTNVINATGGFLGFSFYEYFNDMRLDRNKLVTDYNFK